MFNRFLGHHEYSLLPNLTLSNTILILNAMSLLDLSRQGSPQLSSFKICKLTFLTKEWFLIALFGFEIRAAHPLDRLPIKAREPSLFGFLTRSWVNGNEEKKNLSQVY